MSKTDEFLEARLGKAPETALQEIPDFINLLADIFQKHKYYQWLLPFDK